jgi:L-aminoadipate-semialdehyde dehydrogenase
MGALKAGATVSVLDPQYPPDRQKILLDVARPAFLVCIRRAIQESGELDGSVTDFVAESLSVKATVPALCLADDGGLRGGNVRGVDCLEPQSSRRSELPHVQVGPDSVPTLSFTSGSEGRPKGVQGRFFSLTYYFPWMAERFGLSEDDRFSMLSGIAHDPIQRDIFTPLFLAAKLYIPPAEVITYELLAEWMKTHGITVTHLTPAMGQVLVGGSVTQFPALRNAFFVGDLLTKKDCTKLRNLAPNTNVINLYGSTETQRAVSYFPVPSKNRDPDFLDQLPDIIPIGQGMLNVQLLVIDQNDRTRQCAVGEQGEIYIRAAGLAEGYLGNDAKTAELNRTKFVSNWFVDPAKWTDEFAKLKLSDASKPWMAHYKGPRDRVYRTGDIGRIRSDGSAECIGRVDLQVKIRGFRIELGEIDVHLSQHKFVRENITVVRRDKDEEQTLVTYFVPETKRWIQHLREQEGRQDVGLEPPDESMAGMLRRFKTLSLECKQYLATKLPKYAVPNIIIPLARMPLSKHAVDCLHR